MLAAHDKRRLLDQGQALLDLVGHRRPQGRHERTNAGNGGVACGDREQRPRFPPCITQSTIGPTRPGKRTASSVTI